MYRAHGGCKPVRYLSCSVRGVIIYDKDFRIREIGDGLTHNLFYIFRLIVGRYDDKAPHGRIIPSKS